MQYTRQGAEISSTWLLSCGMERHAIQSRRTPKIMYRTDAAWCVALREMRLGSTYPSAVDMVCGYASGALGLEFCLLQCSSNHGAVYMQRRLRCLSQPSLDAVTRRGRTQRCESGC